MRNVWLRILVTGMLMTGGCAMCTQNSAFDADGLPKAMYYVGGGFSLNFTAPKPGIVYVVEEKTNTLIFTESIDEGRKYSIDIDPGSGEDKMRLKAIGINPSDMKLGLYFIPQKKILPKD